MHTVRWGIIGCGDVDGPRAAPRCRRHRALPSSQSCVAWAKPRITRTGTASPRVTDDGWIHRDPEVDAVFVVTPPWGHAPSRSWDAGKPCSPRSPWR